jgi:hypothetical protein
MRPTFIYIHIKQRQIKSIFLWLLLVTPSFCHCKFTILITSDQSLFYTLHYVSKCSDVIWIISHNKSPKSCTIFPPWLLTCTEICLILQFRNPGTTAYFLVSFLPLSTDIYRSKFFPSILQHSACCGFLVSGRVMAVTSSYSAEILCIHATTTPTSPWYLVYTYARLDLANLWTYLFGYYLNTSMTATWLI